MKLRKIENGVSLGRCSLVIQHRTVHYAFRFHVNSLRVASNSPASSYTFLDNPSSSRWITLSTQKFEQRPFHITSIILRLFNGNYTQLDMLKFLYIFFIFSFYEEFFVTIIDTNENTKFASGDCQQGIAVTRSSLWRK